MPDIFFFLDQAKGVGVGERQVYFSAVEKQQFAVCKKMVEGPFNGAEFGFDGLPCIVARGNFFCRRRG